MSHRVTRQAFQEVVCPAGRWPERLALGFGVFMALGFVLDAPARAIPSPDVMVNLFASAAQVLGLASIVFGRWFFVNRRANSRGARGKSYRAALAVSAGLCVATSVGWFLYATSVRDENLARLQVNLNRNSKEEGRKIVDVSLKELSFSDQLKRQDGVTTEDFAREIESGREMQVLDVRESEEFEVGNIRGVRHVRFPDLLASPETYVDRGRGLTLLCFNGNRSSELAGHFESLGYTCRFLIGGYEKWLAEDRPLEMNGAHERQELREIPEYPNKDILLDTPDVMALIESRNPSFLDVRYPGDFETLGHLPGAVNVPMRKLTTPELDAAFAALPKDRPVIVPCYDKRSSFFALVAGLRLSRMGYEFLGRYTVPESFAVVGKDKPHVAAWKAEHEPKSLLTMVADPLGGALVWTRSHMGSLALAILALVLALRLAIAPLTLKAERDRRVQKRLAPALARLKERFQDDFDARSKATSRLFREHKIQPLLNFVAAVVQLLVFTVFFTVVQRAATGSTESFLWIDALGAPDATRVLPLLVALLGAALVALVVTGKYARWIAPLAALGLGALCFELSAASNLYLVASLVLVVAQTLVAGLLFVDPREREIARRARIAARHARATVVPLSVAHLVPGCGGKADRLGRMLEAGLPVPGGFVVRAAAIEARRRTGHFSPEDCQAILAAFQALRVQRVAVRSSGLNEDGAEKSYAGVFESILDVRHESLFEALDKVADSLISTRAGAYSTGADETGAIVVQAMVPASWAGVLFTEHPGESGAAAVEMIPGLGDALVSGRAQPQAYRLGRFTGRLLSEPRAPIDLAPLFALGRTLESLFGVPQDVEWAFAEGRFHLLQARDVTRHSRMGDGERAIQERERAKLLDLAQDSPASEIVLAQNELAELLPEPTPFSLAFMDALWAYGGSTHLACRSLGIPYDVEPDSAPYVVTAFGSLYVNKREERRRLARGPSTVAAFRLARGAEELERAWREDFLPGEQKRMRLDDALDLGRLDLDSLLALFRERRADFVTRGYVRAEEINIAADFHLKSALRALEKRGLDPARQLAHIPPTVVHEALEILARAARGEDDPARFLEVFGHRAPQDYELSSPRYREDPELVRSLMARSAGAVVSPSPEPELPAGRVLALAVQRARRYQALKEEAKHHALRDLAFLRSILLEIGVRLSLGAGIFQLTPDEVERLANENFRMREAEALVARRTTERDALTVLRLPSELTVADLEGLDVERGGTIPRPVTAGALRGTRVSGAGGVIGRARVLRAPEEIAGFQKGEILVARFTDPTWTAVFPLCKGLVTEVGGWLSHAAIQAREYGITGIVGASGALDALATGDLLRLAPDGTVDRLDERRTEVRVPAEIRVQVQRSTGSASGRIHDLSSHGALLVVQNAKLEIGEHVDLVPEEGFEHFEARVVRNGVPGIYGLSLTVPRRTA